MPALQVPMLAGCPAEPPRILENVVATQTFQERVAEDVTLHQLLEGPLPPLLVGHDHVRIVAADRSTRLRDLGLDSTTKSKRPEASGFASSTIDESRGTSSTAGAEAVVTGAAGGRWGNFRDLSQNLTPRSS